MMFCCSINRISIIDNISYIEVNLILRIHCYAYYLVFSHDIDKDGWLQSRIYEKRGDFNFQISITHFTALTYILCSIFISQLKHYAVACVHDDTEFMNSIVLFTQKRTEIDTAEFWNNFFSQTGWPIRRVGVWIHVIAI